MRPNILYLHCHDAGRYIEPYGHAVSTPGLRRLASEGVLFRQAFCAGPTCSPSRAGLLTGQACHSSGMYGLAHLGWSLNDYRQHLIHTLKSVGYHTAIAGVQHVANFEREGCELDVIGYDEKLDGRNGGTHENSRVVADRGTANAAAEYLRTAAPGDRPFFLSVGFIMPHRVFARAEAQRACEDPRFVRPPSPLPDLPEIRQDMADYNSSACIMDACCDKVLAALEASGLAEKTLVIATTDHGIAFPQMKASLKDHGTGVYLIMRGPGGFSGGKEVDALISQIDLFPTLCDLLGIKQPQWLQGKSFLSVVRGTTNEVNQEIFAETNYHTAYEPQRSIRTKRWKLIKRFDPEWTSRVGANCDDGPSKERLIKEGWLAHELPGVELYDLLFDPQESRNRAQDQELAQVRKDLERQLHAWMRRTGDPLLDGPIDLPTEGTMWPVDVASIEDCVAGKKKFAAD